MSLGPISNLTSSFLAIYHWRRSDGWFVTQYKHGQYRPNIRDSAVRWQPAFAVRADPEQLAAVAAVQSIAIPAGDATDRHELAERGEDSAVGRRYQSSQSAEPASVIPANNWTGLDFIVSSDSARMHQSPDPKTEEIAGQLFRGHYTSLLGP